MLSREKRTGGQKIKRKVEGKEERRKIRGREARQGRDNRRKGS